MITVNQVTVAFATRKLFENVNIKFTEGNCYGLIGANGAGKSTFLKVLSSDIQPTSGDVHMPPEHRLSMLKQDHFAYDDYTVMDTVLMGNSELYKIKQEKDAIYLKDPFTEADGERAAELEAMFAELQGWEAESEAAILLSGLGIEQDLVEKKMSELKAAEKVKVLLAQALIGNPDVLLLDEPTNHLDIKAIKWLEEFLLDFKNTVIVVSHDRHFLNKVCSHMADIDYGQIKIYKGNYNFWHQSAELAMRLRSEKNKRSEEKAKELKDFIARFSANASKSKQATSRRKLLEKLDIEELPQSSRKFPYVQFKPEREVGQEILQVHGISKSIEGELVLDNVSFVIRPDEKVAFFSSNDTAISLLFKILSGEIEPDSGEYQWGVTTSTSYFPKDNSEFFKDTQDLNLIDWLTQYAKTTEEKEEQYIRGLLGRMLFSGDEATKMSSVLSGGERVRCMLAKMMLSGANILMLDGPTYHLDLDSITAVNNGLQKFKGNILFSSHDHEFIQTIANRIITLDKTVVFDEVMTYDDYLEKVS